MGLEKELQVAKMSMSEEEFKQHQKMKRLEAEAQEEVRIALHKQREAKMKALKAAQPQTPKEITVIAGDGKAVKIQLGGDQHEDRADDKGSAPWMGTLRHVVHDNKVTRNYGVNQHQSKRYPDEDAGNPYESLGGSNAKPAFPLTPAAIINGSVMSRDDMARM